MDNKLGTILLCIVMCLFCGGIGFMAGQKYERDNSSYLKFSLDERGVIIDSREPRK